MSRILQASAASVSVATAILVCAMSIEGAAQNSGWKVLFDGKSLDAWRVYKKTSAGDGWKIVDGVLYRAGEAGDLITKEQFGDFELTLEWKIAEGGNSGIFFRGTEDSEVIWYSAPEVQVLDNAHHKDGQAPITSAGSNYAVHPPVRDVTKPVGEWNSVRLVVKGPHVEHWLNGVKVVEYELFSPDWNERVKKSKFVEYPQYGRAARGHIGLQDHGDPVWFRNIRIRPL
jgi:3-keto-disaccharide hydrolase